MLTSTTPALPALSDYSLHPRHTWPTGPSAQLVCFPHRSLCARSISLWLLSLGVCSCRVHPCAPRAHLTVMVTPRAHCHFTMQARALRVPELCDDHTTPSCLVANSLAESRYRSVGTLALPDPSLAQWGLVTLLACALHWPFIRSCDLAHYGLYCSHVCAYTHHISLQPLPFRCLPSLFSRGRTSEHAAVSWHHRVESLLLHGHSALRTTLSPAATSWCELPAPCADIWPPHGSHMLQRLQALCPAHRLHTVPSVHRFRRVPLAPPQVT